MLKLSFCLLAILIGGCADDFVLHPPPGHVDPGKAQRQTVEVRGKEVEIWVSRSPRLKQLDEPRAFVLEFCGNGTRAEQIADFVAQRWGRFPVEVWVMNYPGYGGSAGKPRLGAIPPAALAAYDQLRGRAGERPIFLEANSLGTSVALYVASERPVAALILQNPPPLQRMIVQRYGWWNLWLGAGLIAMQVPGELDALRTAPRVNAPAVFLLSEQDTLVPPYYQNLVVKAYAGPKSLIRMPGDHNDGVRGPAVIQLQQEMDRLWKSVIAEEK